MIKNSFVFLEKVSAAKEKNIWLYGIKDWSDFLRVSEIKGISCTKKSYYERKIKEAQEALGREDSGYFVGKLPATEMWRLYEYFKDECGFLDIEVDSYGKIVVVGISNYYHTNTFVLGANLDGRLVVKELEKYKIIITFNGGAFDLPKLKKQLGIEIKVPHIDLKPLCVKLGLRGGLKEVERMLNLKRPGHLYGNPVQLWKAFNASGDREYLDLLIAYNNEDIENLKGVINYCYKELKRRLVENLQNN